MAKRASKRVSEKRKTKRVQKNARSEAKERRKQRKKQKNNIKVPSNILLTEEQKAHLNEIKTATKERTAEIKSQLVIEEPEVIKNIKKSIYQNNCDIFIEVIDSRDIEGSRCKIAEDQIALEGKKLYFYSENNAIISDFLAPVLSDFSPLHNAKICIFGNLKSGKFTLSKKIEEFFKNKNIFFDFIRTPSDKITASEVFRNQIDVDKVDLVFIIYQFWKFINKEDLKNYYKIASFGNLEEFLTNLGEKYFDEVEFMHLSKSKNLMKKAACFFIQEIKSGKIEWRKMADEYSFNFN